MIYSNNNKIRMQVNWTKLHRKAHLDNNLRQQSSVKQ